ncbi:MAG: RDD family protein [Methanotrichaceae archaeon]|nr:RDD family protein [Methanotrichaceae archaeon]
MAGTEQSEIMKAPVILEYQGIGIRFVSLLIDSIVLGLLLGALGAILGVGRASGTAEWGWGLFYFLVYLAYFTYLEGSRGQTVGKMITKIKVVGENGGKIDMNQAFVRNILRIIDGLFVYLIGAILIWRSDKKQRLGDSIGKTVVVKA